MAANISENYNNIISYFHTCYKPLMLFTRTKKGLWFVVLCKTRSSERDVSYKQFYLAMSFAIKMFEVMKNGSPIETDTFENFLTGCKK